MNTENLGRRRIAGDKLPNDVSMTTPTYSGMVGWEQEGSDGHLDDNARFRQVRSLTFYKFDGRGFLA
jgi:hypothetical protein